VIPVKERGMVKGINFSGSRIGPRWPCGGGLAYPPGRVETGISDPDAHRFGWALFWWFWFRDIRKNNGRSSTSWSLSWLIGRSALRGVRRTAPNGGSISLGNLWLLMAQYFGSNFTFFFSLTWLYPYVQGKYQLSAVDAGFYAMVPLLGGAAGNILSGGLVDALYRRGLGVLSRRLPAMIGFALAALGMVLSIYQATALGAVLWLTVAIFGADMTLSPSWSSCIDIGGPHAGAVSGTMNMAGNLGSAITALAFAYMPESARGNEFFFFTAAGLSVLAIVCWLMIDPRCAIQQMPSASRRKAVASKSWRCRFNSEQDVNRRQD